MSVDKEEDEFWWGLGVIGAFGSCQLVYAGTWLGYWLAYLIST